MCELQKNTYQRTLLTNIVVVLQTSNKKSYRIAIGISGIFLCLDQLLKYFAYTHQSWSAYIMKPWLGWEYLGNTGVAFSLPVPNVFLVTMTPLLLLLLFILFAKKRHKSQAYLIAITLIFGGAVSNYIDRVLFSITIDYIRVITSVCNIADLMIIVGAVWIVIQEFQPNTEMPE